MGTVDNNDKEREREWLRERDGAVQGKTKQDIKMQVCKWMWKECIKMRKWANLYKCSVSQGFSMHFLMLLNDATYDYKFTCKFVKLLFLNIYF